MFLSLLRAYRDQSLYLSGDLGASTHRAVDQTAPCQGRASRAGERDLQVDSDDNDASANRNASLNAMLVGLIF